MENNFDTYAKDIPHELLVRIKSIYANLKTAEKKAADTILANPRNVALFTISEIANLAECSEATLVRLSRKLGFGGYTEFKSFLIEIINHEHPLPYDEISDEDDPCSVAEKVFKASQQALMDTLSLLDKSQYEEAVGYICNSKRLFFIGSGDAYTVAYSAYLKFSRIGCNVKCSKDYDTQLIETSKLNQEDVLIIISHSGRTASLLEVAKLAKLNQVKIITITNYPLSPLAKISDVILLTAVFNAGVYNETMAKRLPELCIIETLYINALMQVNDEQKTLFQNTLKAITINKI